jgi:hypothetical protein
MKRPDSDLIRRLIKSKALNSGKKVGSPNHWNALHQQRPWTLDKILGLPYFYLSYRNMEEFDFTTGDDFPDANDGTLLGNPVKVIEKKHNGVDVVRSYAHSAEFVYEEFVLSAKTDIQLELHDGSVATAPVNYWGIVNAFNNETDCSDALTLFIEYPEAPKQVLVWEGWADSNNVVEPNGQSIQKINMVMAPDYEEDLREWYQHLLARGLFVENRGGFDQFASGLTGQAGNYYLFICKLMSYIKYGDKHVVEVTPTPDKLAKAKRNPVNRKRPWAKSSGPHVLLLDRMPTEKTESTGTHASPKPHKRRGYWKTLRDPIYRHHPQYQKQIFVKPCFVGEKQVTYEGNIYRLVEPLEEIA